MRNALFSHSKIHSHTRLVPLLHLHAAPIPPHRLTGPMFVQRLNAEGVPEWVVFEDGDGNFLDAIAVPAGSVVFVDNGDSTWSAGS